MNLQVCDRTHGGPHNSATVYGHWAPNRTCIRLFDSNTWVFDPGWENETREERNARWARDEETDESDQPTNA